MLVQRGWSAAACVAVVASMPAAADVVPFFAFCDLRPADPALNALVELRGGSRLSIGDGLFREGLQQLPIGPTFQAVERDGTSSGEGWFPEAEPIFAPEPLLGADPVAAPEPDDAWLAGPASLASVSF